MSFRRRHSGSGFTLVELLVVIGIIATLMGILIPALNRARDSARQAVCMAQIRQVTSAWINYAADNRGALVSSDTWKLGWAGSSDTTDAVRNGLLFKYIADPQVYRCPLDPNKSNLRTYSLNAYLNGEGKPCAHRLGEVRDPSMTFVAIEEWDPRGYNINSFIIPPTGNNWVDFPATWHNYGCNISFCDGRVESWQWTDPRTRLLDSFGVSTPNNADLKRLQTVSYFK